MEVVMEVVLVVLVLGIVIMEVDDDNAIGHLAGSQGPGTQATGAKKRKQAAEKTSKAGKARQQGPAGRQDRASKHCIDNVL